MKNQIIKYLIGCISIVFLLSISSCSIEKRRYQDGYHVEWHHKKKQNSELKEVAVQEEEVALFEPKEQGEKNEALIINEEVGSSSDEMTQASTESELVVIEKKQLVFEKDTITPGDDYFSNKRSGEEINESAKNSKIAGLLGIGSVIASILLSFAASDTSLVFLSALANSLFIAALGFAIFAIVLGKKAKRQMADLKDRYANGTDADIGLILGWIVVGFYILAALIFILALIILILLFF